MKTGETILKAPTTGASDDLTLTLRVVKNNEYVEREQVICEFETDKAVVEFEAKVAGHIEWLVKEGSELKVGDDIAIIRKVKPEDIEKKKAVENTQEEKIVENIGFIPFSEFKELLEMNRELTRENEAYKHQISTLEEKIKNLE